MTVGELNRRLKITMYVLWVYAFLFGAAFGAYLFKAKEYRALDEELIEAKEELIEKKNKVYILEHYIKSIEN